ncbi:MAG: alpha/beta hydrolase, partial [bacterium]|nr:alpha/beta hydrolase [bacterium]
MNFENKRLVQVLIIFLMVFLVAQTGFTREKSKGAEKSVEKSREKSSGDKPLIIGKSFKFKSKVLDEERTIFISVPQRYTFSEEKFPVLYLLDAGGNFHYATGIVDFFGTKAMTAPLIVVGITNRGRKSRIRDLTPTNVKQMPASGGADQFLKFMSTELFPYIEKNYRTQPYRILAGHSLAGMFTVYTMLNSPEIANSYIALSPYVGYDEGYLLKNAETMLKKNMRLKKYLFMGVGAEPNIEPGVREFATKLETIAPKG